MGIPVFVPVMRCIKELSPCWRSLPVLVHVICGLHETLDGAMFGAFRLLQCKLESGFELFPISWLTFFPGLGWCDGNQGLGDCLEIGASSLSSPRMLLEQVLFGL